MRKRPTILGIFLAFAAGILVSCESFQGSSPSFEPPIEQKTIRRVALPPDAVAFDAVLVSAPYEDRDLIDAFWRDVDELAVDAEMRRALNEQGFRAGLLGASIPESLSRLLTLKGRALRASLEEEVDLSKNDAANAPTTRSKPVKLRAGMKSYIETRDDVVPSIPILENENGALVGKSYKDARPIFSVSIEQIPDGSVRFDVTPFLRYGTSKSVGRYQHGQLVRTQEQPTKTFDYLKCSLALRPGQFFVIGASDATTSALGRYFFGDGGDDYDQKILVLRLLVTQHDGQFNQFPDFNELTQRENAKNRENGEIWKFNEENAATQNKVDGFESSTPNAQNATRPSAPLNNPNLTADETRESSPDDATDMNFFDENDATDVDSDNFSDYLLDDSKLDDD